MKPNFEYRGSASWFGGPADDGVTTWEGLALYEEDQIKDHPTLFLPQSQTAPQGLAKRLNPEAYYCACRWDYKLTPKALLRKCLVQVQNASKPSVMVLCIPVDYGPAEWTKRIIDISPAAMRDLCITTDRDEVIVKILDFQGE